MDGREEEPQSPYRQGTTNLIVSGLETELAEFEEHLRSLGVGTYRFDPVITYEKIPEIPLREPDGTTRALLVQTMDSSGMELKNTKPSEARRWFDPFDSVHAITEAFFDGGNRAVGICSVKEHGQYIGIFGDED